MNERQVEGRVGEDLGSKGRSFDKFSFFEARTTSFLAWINLTVSTHTLLMHSNLHDLVFAKEHVGDSSVKPGNILDERESLEAIHAFARHAVCLCSAQ
jgi:hypothetical protein